METMSYLTIPSGETREICDKVAREQTFQPMDNFEINNVITDIFD